MYITSLFLFIVFVSRITVITLCHVALCDLSKNKNAQPNGYTLSIALVWFVRQCDTDCLEEAYEGGSASGWPLHELFTRINSTTIAVVRCQGLHDRAVMK